MMKLIQKQYKMEQKNNPSWKEKYEELQATFNTLKSLFNGRWSYDDAGNKIDKGQRVHLFERVLLLDATVIYGEIDR